MTITDKVKILATIREEIQAATGYRYGRWWCECGKFRSKGYKDSRNHQVPMCHGCGKAMKFQDVT